MVTEVDAATALVLTGKVALVAPSETVTLAGTVAAALLLERETTAPSRGAGARSVTVPVEERPPVTLVGLRLSKERTDRKRVVEGKSVDVGGRRVIKKK